MRNYLLMQQEDASDYIIQGVDVSFPLSAFSLEC
jgi:hypothetical protein